jgi:hypothetical protein
MSVKSNIGVVTDGLVFYVDAANGNSYPGTGTTWSDLIGSNDGTLTNGPTYDSANAGSVVFDGTNDKVSFPNDSSFKPTGSMTVLCWAKGNSGDTSVTMLGTIGPSGNRGWFMGCNNSIFRFSIAPTSTSLFDSIATKTDTTSAPFMLTGVFDAGNSISLYKNTTQINTNTSSVPSTQHASSNPLEIGSRGDSFSRAFWDGNIYCAMIYDRALSASEIEQNYNALKNRFI